MGASALRDSETTAEYSHTLKYWNSLKNVCAKPEYLFIQNGSKCENPCPSNNFG